MRDSARIEALWNAWDADDSFVRAVDPDDASLIATVHRLRSLNRVYLPDPTRAKAIRADLVRSHVPSNVSVPSGGMGGVQTMERPSIRVLIVEREPLFRRGLIACLDAEQSIEVVGDSSSAKAGYRLADELQPDVLLVGTTLEDAPGLVAATEFRRYYPSIATIVMGARESDDELFAAIRAGASAYCGQDVDEQRLIGLIRRSATGEYVINEQLLTRPYVAARVLDQFRAATLIDPSPTSAFAPLTNRELEILRKVSDGLTNAEIGYDLVISSQTVKNHVTSILRKLSVNDRTQAVMTALRRGWISLDDQASPRSGTDAVSQGDASSG